MEHLQEADGTYNQKHSGTEQPKEAREHKHHHHSSGHSGKTHGSSRRRRSNKVQKFIKKHKKLLTVVGTVLIVAILIAMIFLLDGLEQKMNHVPQETKGKIDSEVKVTATTICIEAPLFTEEIELVPRAARLFANRDLSLSLDKVIDRYKAKDERLDVGNPVEIAFEVSGLPEGQSVASSKIEVSESDTFEKARVFSLQGEERSAKVYYLKTGTLYYFRISITLSGKTVTSVQGTFQTANTPRLLSVEGAVNVRDVGGWKTEEGKVIRQGLLYRGSELDGAVNPVFCVTEKGRNNMLERLGIRMDMDLRSPADNKNGTDALGANVLHVYYDAPMYGDVFSNTVPIKNVFSDLADENNYPVYLHCTYGRDRTGTVCYLLGALLGMSEDDLQREYELTVLYYGGIPGDCASKMDAFVEAMKLQEGATMQEKAEGYLLSIGVTEEEIASIKNIFLE